MNLMPTNEDADLHRMQKTQKFDFRELDRVPKEVTIGFEL